MSLFVFMTEHLIEEEEAKALTHPYWRELAKVWRLSWRRWRRLKEDDRRRLGDTPTVRPVMLNGWVQSFATETFSNRENDGVVVCDAIPGVFAFYIKDKLLIRFNGLSNGYIVHCDESNSKLKRDYFAQEPIRDINSHATRLTVGYTLNAAKTDMERIEISLQVGNDLVYHFPIHGGESMTLPVPTPKRPPELEMPTSGLRQRKPR